MRRQCGLRCRAWVSPGCCTYQCEQAISDGKLEIIRSAYEPAPLPIHLLHAGRGALPLKMRAFLDFAAP
jgi:hypothetical protein